MAKKYRLSVYNLLHERLCVLYDSEVEQLGSAHSIKITKEISGWKEVSFALSKFDSNGDPNYRWNLIRNENLLYLEEDDRLDVYCIKEPAEVHDATKIQMVVSCVHISEELKTKNMYAHFDDTNGIGTIEELVGRALSGTGWTLGVCDKFLEVDGIHEKIRSYKCDTKTGTYNMIAGICQLFNARPVYHGAEKVVDIFASTNSTGWMEIQYGKNAESVQRNPNSDSMVTRLYVEGEYGDFGYVGIDDVNPTGLPFILNFDYYKELGLFTENHQKAVDDYLVEYKACTDAMVESTKKTLECRGKLNNLIGHFGYAAYPVSDNKINEDQKIVGQNVADEDIQLKDGDMVALVYEDGTYIYAALPYPLSNEIYVIKFVPTISGMLAAYEDSRKAIDANTESLLEELDLIVDPTIMGSVTVDSLKQLYEVDDLEKVRESSALGSINVDYTTDKVLGLVEGIGSNERKKLSYEEKMKSTMLEVISLMRDINENNSAYDENFVLQAEIESAFNTAMGSMLRDGYWSDNNYAPGQEESLYNDALSISEKLAKPITTYKVGIRNLSRLEKYKDEEFILAMTVRIYDDVMGINDYAMVSKLIICPDRPLSDSAEVTTDILNIGSKTFASILERVTEMAERVRQNKEIYERAVAISKNGTIQSATLEGAIDVLKNRLLSSTSNWRTDANGNVIFESLDGSSAMMLSGNGFMCASKKTNSGEWDWRTFGTGEGFTADLIVAGFLSAERIEAHTITARHLAADVGENLDLSSNKTINITADMINQVADQINLEGNTSIQMIVSDKVNEEASKFTVTDDQIMSAVKKSDEYKDMNTQIAQTAEQIGLMASSDEVDQLKERVEQAELKVTPDAISAVVKKETEEMEQKVAKNEADISVLSDEVSFRVTSEQMDTAVGNAVNDLEIGGVNLIEKADLIVVDGPAANDDALMYFVSSECSSYKKLKEGIKYTLSFDVSEDSTITSISLGDSVFSHSLLTIRPGARNRFTAIFHGRSDTDLALIKANMSGSIRFTNVKLERGSKATDWSPAPEDVDKDVSELEARVSSAELKVEDDAIISVVQKSQTYKDLEERMSTAETSIEQKADSIKLSALEKTVTDIQVGGTNLIANKHMTVGYAYVEGQVIYDELYMVSDYISVEPDEEIMFQLWTPNKKNIWYGITYFDSEKIFIDGSYAGQTVVDTDYIKKQYTIPSGVSYLRMSYVWEFGYKVKLEKGNQATDWSMSPFDPASELKTGTSVTITDDEFNVQTKTATFNIIDDSTGEDEELVRIDSDGLTGKVGTFDMIYSDSVVSTRSPNTFVPNNAGTLQAFFDDLSGRYLTTDVIIDASNVSGGTFTIKGMIGKGFMRIDNGVFNDFTIERCTAPIYFYYGAFSTSGAAVKAKMSTIYMWRCSIFAGTGIDISNGWTDLTLDNCSGECNMLADVQYRSVLNVIGGSVPYGIPNIENGGEVYSEIEFQNIEHPVETPVVTEVTLKATTKTYGGGWLSGYSLYQGRTGSNPLRQGCMWFDTSDIVGKEIISATLMMKRYDGIGGGGAVTVGIYGTSVTSASGTPNIGSKFASVSIANGASKTVDVTAAVQALADGTIGGLMIYDSQLGTFNGKNYTYGYSKFYGSDTNNTPTLKVTYK